MKAYTDIIQKILDTGYRKENRTGTDALTIGICCFEHDMSEGFPILTTKKLPWKRITAELEFFIKGLTTKRWLQDQNCHIWDDWCTSKSLEKYDFSEEGIATTAERLFSLFEEQYAYRKPIPRLNDKLEKVNGYFKREERIWRQNYGSEQFDTVKDDVRKLAQHLEEDLGPIYGFQWRHADAKYRGPNADYTGEGADQLEDLVNTLKTNPQSRRMIVDAWPKNRKVRDTMALPPCHYGFQVTTRGDKLDLAWNQRSVDVMLGLPFNIASYGLLLHLLAKEAGLKEGKLGGFLMDTHIYVNHIEGAREQLSREPLELPSIKTLYFTSIFDWSYQQTERVNYKSHPKITFDIAI